MVMSPWDWDEDDVYGRFRSAMDRLFADFAGDHPALSGWGTADFPAINLWEDEEALSAEAELPGLKMEDLEVSVQGQELILRGERKEEAAPETSYPRRERFIGPFHRSVPLPADVDPEKIEATLENGILTVRMPKSSAAKPRRIEVKRLTRNP